MFNILLHCNVTAMEKKNIKEYKLIFPKGVSLVLPNAS